MHNGSIQEQHRLENRLMEAIRSRYEGEDFPETVIVAVSPELEVVALGTYGQMDNNPDTEGWTIEEIDTDNLTDNVTDVASCYFDPRY